MRLFVGVEIDEDIRRRMAELTDELRRRVSIEAPRARVTWVSADRLHVTLRFIGTADERAVAAIREHLRDPLPVAPFRLSISSVGTFPLHGRPRVVWAGIDTGREALIEIERRLTARLEQIGILAEQRPYTPHVTLGRVRDASGLRSASLLEGLTDRTFGTMSLGAITLFESRLSAKGPDYVVLQGTALRAG